MTQNYGLALPRDKPHNHTGRDPNVHCILYPIAIAGKPNPAEPGAAEAQEKPFQRYSDPE